MDDLKNLEIEYKNKLYADPGNVKEKWIRNYGKLSEYAGRDSYISCIKEAFNMTEVIMGHIIFEFRSENEASAESVTFEKRGRMAEGFKFPGIDAPIDFSDAKTFFGKAEILGLIGYEIPENLNDVRNIRNITTHNTATVIGEVYNESLSYENVLCYMRILGRLLVTLKMLDEEDIEPPFEKLRVKPGDYVGVSNEFRIDEFVAEGGMSRVFKAVHMRLGSTVAVKELKPYTYRPEQILAEKDFLISMRHPQIPQIFDIIAQNKTHYIVMEYIDGDSLEDYVAEFNPDLEERFAIMLNIAQVLSYIHDGCDMIYAELKPDNVMIGNKGSVYLIDFSISQAVAEENIANAFNLQFSAPEQKSGGNVDKRADIYAFGSLLDWIIPDKEELGYEREDMEQLIKGCKAENPDKRYDSMEFVRNRLLSISQDTLNKTVAKKKRRRGIVVGAILAVVISAVLTAFIYVNVCYPKGQVYNMQGVFAPSIEETAEGLEATLSLYNRSDEDILMGKVYMMTVNIITKDGQSEVKIPCRLDEGLKSGHLMLKHKYLMDWETLGLRPEDIIEIDRDNIQVQLF